VLLRPKLFENKEHSSPAEAAKLLDTCPKVWPGDSWFFVEMKKLRVVTKAAAVRVAVVLVLLGGGVGWGWLTMIRMPLQSYSGPWTPLAPAEAIICEALRRDVEMLAGEIGERNVFRPRQLAAATGFIEKALEEGGYQINRYGYEVSGETCFNLEAVLPGGVRSNEVVVVGAHYDSTFGTPGANDNATGVAALLQLARVFANLQPERTVRFVAFVNEEPPFFQTEQMGSVVYARQCRARGDNIVAMISLETIGYYSETPGSQRYPFPVGLFYPSKGNFIAFVGDWGSGALVRQSVASFRREAKFPSEGAALPRGLPGIGWSDHWAFWQAGYPAIMVTDTAPFRYPWYHTEEDTPEKIGYERMARVVGGLGLVLADLAGSQGPAGLPSRAPE
jgi:hypothetical protein